MATDNSDCFVDGAVHSRTLLFNGTNYSLWKGRIKEFLMEIDFELWFVVKLGYKGQIRDTDQITDIDQLKDIPKEEKIAMSMDAKAKNILVCALTRQEYNRLCNCDTAKKNWGGIHALIKSASFTPPTDVGYYTCSLLKKMLVKKNKSGRYLGPYQVTGLLKLAIQEAKDLSTKTIGSLTSREITLFNKEGIPDSKESKNIAFNTRLDTEKETRDEQDDSEFDDELAMITKRIQRLGNFRSKNRKIKPNKKE
ncbi:hypothetical protein CDL12_30505 [Handroanthus impetiginosus]|uniref:DUF4219 domain-containing protein n=1 Tax=Handroanthus impetiginosus TaxID=429701 RepID=A0A2G9FVD7_9LAMI|nr:hypothetical protein CDL12_30505 [Handroanthus impetiginosus]